MLFKQIVEDPQKPIPYPSGDDGKPGRLELKLIYGKKIASHRELIAAGTLATAVILEFLLFLFGWMQKLDFLSFELLSLAPILLCSLHSIFVWKGDLSENLQCLNAILFWVEFVCFVINMVGAHFVHCSFSIIFVCADTGWPSYFPKLLNFPIYDVSFAQWLFEIIVFACGSYLFSLTMDIDVNIEILIGNWTEDD